jgi:hypothetical protein
MRVLLVALAGAAVAAAVAQAASAGTVTVELTILGNGAVASDVGGIDCTRTGGTQSGVCAGQVTDGSMELAATPASGWELDSWSDECDPGDLPACVIASEDEDTTVEVTATFVDVEAPTVSLLEPADGAIFGLGVFVVVKATASDNTGVAFVQYYVDGEPVGAPVASPLTDYRQNIPLSQFPEGLVTITAEAVDPQGNSTLSASRQIVVDKTRPPVPAIGARPPKFSKMRGATFTFSSEAGATFECRLDGAAFAACATPRSYSGLGEGEHRLDVRAVDGAGNRSATHATYTWTVDTKRPNTLLKARPPAQTKARRATVRFASSEPQGARFQCKLDKGAWKACSSPRSYGKLKPGRHTFRVRALDRAGNVDGTPVIVTWRIRR